MSKNFTKPILRQRIIQLLRSFFINRNFQEVDTPVIMPTIPIEPNLYPLKTIWTHRQLDFYLATSPESSLKKLIADNLGNCFSIAKVFRDLEDIGPTHNLEFSMLEWYELGHDYHHLSQTSENLIIDLYDKLNNIDNKSINKILNYQNLPIDLTPPWHRQTLQSLFLQFAQIDLATNLTTDQIIATATAKGYNPQGVNSWEPLYTQIFVNEIEPCLPTDKPIFIFDYPTALSPLCSPCLGNPGFSQRFELYIGGMEIANGYTELTDAPTLESNFQAETEFRRLHHLPIHPYDQQLVTATSHFPPCTGIGLGVDRLAMLFANASHINQVLYFPTQDLIK